MIPASFDYAAPSNLEEVIALLQAHHGARVLAGGHDLLTQMKLRHAAPPMLIDLRAVRGLRGITTVSNPDTLQIGAMTTCTDIALHPEVRAHATALAEAADSIGDMQVRNASTIGGNLAYGDPAADLPAALLALDAAILTQGAHGPRNIPADQFFVGSFRTVLDSDEVITAVHIPLQKLGHHSAYEKFKNPANGYPIVGVAASLVVREGGTIVSCRLGVTGSEAHPQRLYQAEDALKGKRASAAAFAAAISQGVASLKGRTDLYASGEYRVHLATILAERALGRAQAG